MTLFGERRFSLLSNPTLEVIGPPEPIDITTDDTHFQYLLLGRGKPG